MNLRRFLAYLFSTSGHAHFLPVQKSIPFEHEFKDLCATVQQTAQKELASKVWSRNASWYSRMTTHDRYRYVAGKLFRSATHVNIAPAGEAPVYTTSLNIVGEKVTTYWKGIWSVPQGNASFLQEELLRCVQPVDALNLNPLRAEDISEAAASSGGCAGPDGWSAGEIKKVSELYGELAMVYNLMERLGVVPSVSLAGDVSLIPKSDNSPHFQKMRPITVVSVFHRLYGAARLRASLFKWQEEAFGDLPFRGCRAGSGCHDLTMALFAEFEASSIQGRDFQVASYDLAKAFDTLPCEPGGFAWKVLKRLGFPEAISNLLNDFYTNIVKRFKMRGFLGEPVFSDSMRGAIQGCSFSMIIMNAMTVPWFRSQRSGVHLHRSPQLFDEAARLTQWGTIVTRKQARLMRQEDFGTRLGGYADDLHAVGSDNKSIHRAHNLTVFWATACRLKLNPDKSLVSGKVKLYIADKELAHTDDLRVLGWHLQRSSRCKTWKIPQKRCDEADARLQRVARLPGNRDDRLSVVATAVIPVLYGIEIYPLEHSEANAFRRNVWRAARQGIQLPWPSALEVLFTICSPGFLVDPKQVADYRMVLLFAACRNLDDASILDMQATLDLLVGGSTPRVWGPVRRCKQVLDSIGWHWTQVGTIITSQGISFNVPFARGVEHKEERDAFCHHLREGLRSREIATLVVTIGKTGSRPGKTCKVCS